MAEKDKKKDFPRDEDGDLSCSPLAGQDRKACIEVQKKEAIEKMPRDDNGNLDCHTLKGDEKSLCNSQKASETMKKGLGMRTH